MDLNPVGTEEFTRIGKLELELDAITAEIAFYKAKIRLLEPKKNDIELSLRAAKEELSWMEEHKEDD